MKFSVGGGLLERGDFLQKIQEILPEIELVSNNKKIEYYNIPAAFDIEVTSFYTIDTIKQKRAIMYIWQFGMFNYITYGRTWEEFISLLSVLRLLLDLSDNRRLIVYVHNLAYEFQFIRKRFVWEEVFLLKERKPVYANAHGIEFRCSWKLSNKSLEDVGKDLLLYKCDKLVGKLDYTILRTPLTPLTKEELAYCENDIRVLLCYIQEKIETDGDITRIPLTNTGYVRQYTRQQCYKRWRKYRNIMESLTLTSEEYSQLKRAFRGGFTHANAHYVQDTLDNVGSHDFTSSYPSVMVLEKFPMSRFSLLTNGISEDELEELLLTQCCLFDIELYDIHPIQHQEHPLSRSKCWNVQNCITDNGSVVMAQHLCTSVTELDYLTYVNYYTWSEMKIYNLRVATKQYLPKPFVEAILTLYERKTKLKHKKGEEINYQINKGMANSAYGMTVTDIAREIIKYIDNQFISVDKTLDEFIDAYNKDIKRFLYYPWGVWITAYARYNLFKAITALGKDYVYADTDSVKSLNTELHQEFFDYYDAEIMEKIRNSFEHFHIPIERYMPKDYDDKIWVIGTWDDEGVSEKFKTLGAKRYMYLKEGKYTLTVAGTNKEKSMQYLESTGKPFEYFDDKLVIPPESSGRLTLTYIDDATEGILVDCNGVPYHYKELSSIHTEPSEYSLKIGEDFAKYLEGYITIDE